LPDAAQAQIRYGKAASQNGGLFDACQDNGSGKLKVPGDQRYENNILRGRRPMWRPYGPGVLPPKAFMVGFGDPTTRDWERYYLPDSLDCLAD
jgi:hypothetical protein